MLITNRDYTKVSRELSPKKIYLFVEGEKREVDYFKMFRSNSKIEILIYKHKDGDDFTATGLYQIAKDCLSPTSKKGSLYCSGNSGKYDFNDEIDEVWIVVDADINRDKIIKAQNDCTLENNWGVILSNPCFEVWLYYHFSDIKLTSEMLKEKGIQPSIDKCKAWKRYVHKMRPGGFSSEEHIKLINEAITNAKRHYYESNNIPEIGATQVYRLAENICQLVQEKKESRKRR